ncbi:hypothetical protein AQUCO_00900803v1 [Aquilegia coerulea]|uniref:PAR1 protein n=1 Tax=Aquilegia coerulea TaxID=218851 RepID=A0A2G5EFG9_AQUCA|nr:hypothetical protein AQUCO_00900803v1 [Aquilegia coerulea]
MALRIQLALFLSLSIFLHGALGEIVCENLPKNLCAFSIASSGKRCLLENYSSKDGKVEYQCKTSEVVVEKMADWMESDECVKSCGVDRNAVGFSSDSLLEPQSTDKICAPACYQNCPNIVDLYFNLAAGEGVFLPDLCEAQRTNPHRAMIELMSSGIASGPASSELYADAPIGSPFHANAPVASSSYSADSPAPAPYFAFDPALAFDIEDAPAPAPF